MADDRDKPKTRKQPSDNVYSFRPNRLEPLPDDRLLTDIEGGVDKHRLPDGDYDITGLLQDQRDLTASIIRAERLVPDREKIAEYFHTHWYLEHSEIVSRYSSLSAEGKNFYRRMADQILAPMDKVVVEIKEAPTNDRGEQLLPILLTRKEFLALPMEVRRRTLVREADKIAYQDKGMMD